MFEKYKQLSGKVKILKSLKARLFVIILLAGVIPSVGMRYAILQSYEDRAVTVRIADVQNQFKILANHLITGIFWILRRRWSIRNWISFPIFTMAGS